MQLRRMFCRRSEHCLAHGIAKWIGECYMADNAFPKEGRGPDALGPIKDLIRNDQVSGANLFLHDADG